MNHQRLIILLLLIAYLFSPSLFTWVISPSGPWYRPYMFWMGVVFVTFIYQWRRKSPTIWIHNRKNTAAHPVK